jgi:hypothetical protein
MWHWAAGNVADPFNIDEGKMVKALQIIWKYVYSTTYVHFDIPPIVSMVSSVLSFLYFADNFFTDQPTLCRVAQRIHVCSDLCTYFPLCKRR